MELPPLTLAVHTTKAPTNGDQMSVDRNIKIQIGQGKYKPVNLYPLHHV